MIGSKQVNLEVLVVSKNTLNGTPFGPWAAASSAASSSGNKPSDLSGTRTGHDPSPKEARRSCRSVVTSGKSAPWLTGRTGVDGAGMTACGRAGGTGEGSSLAAMLPGDAADSGVPGALMVEAGARINRRVADVVVVNCFTVTQHGGVPQHHPPLARRALSCATVRLAIAPAATLRP